MIKVLSREPDKSIFGFSREVAREVTQPLWPSRVPFKMRVSDIVIIVGRVKLVAMFFLQQES
jgi:hypothetical protein